MQVVTLPKFKPSLFYLLESNSARNKVTILVVSNKKKTPLGLVRSTKLALRSADFELIKSDTEIPVPVSATEVEPSV